MDITRREGYKKDESNPFIICENYLKATESVYTIGGTWNEKFEETLAKMFSMVEKLEKDEPLEDGEYTPIEECINFLNYMVIERKREENLIEFIKAFIFIAYNVNENYKQYNAVKTKIGYLQRYCDNALTFEEVINLNRQMTERVAVWKNWLPPSFRLSQHYYDLIKGE